MSEGMEIAVNAEVEDLVYRMKAAGERLEGLVATTNRARDANYHAQWNLLDRLIALKEERPDVRWRVGDRVYWAEGRFLRSEPADPR